MNRRGMALGLVLWVLVIGAAILTVAVFMSAQERRAAGSERRLHLAMTRAEAGLTDALAGWSPGLLSRRLIHPFDSLLVGNLDPSWRGLIRRLNRGLFLVSAEARDPDPSTIATVATLSRLGWLVRARPVLVPNTAALRAGTVRLESAARIAGEDRPPADWDCPPPDTAIGGIAAGSVMADSGTEITGAPPVLVNPADSGFPSSLTAAFDELARQPTLVVPGGTWSPRPSIAGTDCNVSDLLNWGDPRPGVCGDYWPIIHVAGDVELSAGVGHGILLVGGDLRIVGPVEFSGLVLVQGSLVVEPPGGSIHVSGVVVAGRAGTAGRGLSGIEVTYSKCMIDNALLSSGTLIPLRSRAWKQLF